jgi:hypothetical protein
MTCEQIDSEHWRLSFSEPEAGFIVNVLARLARHYEEDLTQMPPALRAYWQSAPCPGKGSRSKEEKEAEEILSESRRELRSERLALAENWTREFEIAENRQPWRVEVSTTERDEFVSMLNDRRLTLALETGISDGEMEMDPSHISDDARRSAILEIDVLGHFILVTLGPQIYRP